MPRSAGLSSIVLLPAAAGLASERQDSSGRPGDHNTRLLMLIDGPRLKESIYDGGYTGTEGIVDVGMIERVEGAESSHGRFFLNLRYDTDLGAS